MEHQLVRIPTSVFFLFRPTFLFSIFNCSIESVFLNLFLPVIDIFHNSTIAKLCVFLLKDFHNRPFCSYAKCCRSSFGNYLCSRPISNTCEADKNTLFYSKDSRQFHEFVEYTAT